MVLTQLFGIGKDAVSWDEIANAAGEERTPQEQMFFCKWVEETKMIILAAREHKFKPPQTVLIARAGLRVRFLLYQARIQGDGSYCCEFLVINEVGGPVLGSKPQMLALLTSVRLAFRFRYELIRHFDNEPDRLSDADRRARILEIPRIIDNLTRESESRGNITLEDLQSAFDNEDDAERIGKLVSYWPFLQNAIVQWAWAFRRWEADIGSRPGRTQSATVSARFRIVAIAQPRIPFSLLRSRFANGVANPGGIEEKRRGARKQRQDAERAAGPVGRLSRAALRNTCRE